MQTKKLIGKISSIQSLNSQQINEMYNLMSKYYDNIKQDNFQKDLSEKKEVILLRDNQNGKIKGFSTLMLLEQIIDDIPITALFSGDTIIDKEYWGGNELSKIWGRYTFSLIDKIQDRKLYWFLLSKGYKTYKFLPIFFNEFYPKYDKHFPEKEKRILDYFAFFKFPKNYDSEKGLVCFKQNKDYLKQGIADINEKRIKDPNIKYFIDKNPFWMKGDELACLIPLAKENFNKMAKRIIKIAD